MVYSYQVIKFQTISFVQEFIGLNQLVIKEFFTNPLKIHFQNFLYNYQMVQKNYTMFQKIGQLL